MKHAYLIIAYNDFETLRKLAKLLDYSNNDLYFHIDKKTRSFSEDMIRPYVYHANVHFVKRVNVGWGSYSMVQAEINLLEEATKTYHDYYHLLSGADLPIKAHETIDAYFEKNKGNEFIHYDETMCAQKKHLYRLRYYFFYPRFLSRALLNNLLNRFASLQRKLGVNRLKGKDEAKIKKGSQWVDITHECACYILRKIKTKEYRRMFKYSFCPDEMFVQTIIYDSPFYKKCVPASRYMDWSQNKSGPEVLSMQDYDKLMTSDYLFARKFNEARDKEIIDKLYNQFVATNH